MLKLNEVERKIWIEFHSFAYKDDIALAEKILNEHPRWAIIIAYYAMHDIAKLYLGKIHNIKIAGQNIHRQTIDGLKVVIKNENEKNRIVNLLETAEKEIKEIRPEEVPYLLIAGKKERGKAQYYSSRVLTKNIDYTKKAEWFIKRIGKVFIRIMEKLAG